MLRAIGVKSVRDLFASIPENLRHKGALDLPKPMSEQEAAAHLAELAGLNTPVTQLTSFLGGGAYDHYIPAVVDAVSSRGEFFTAYTPYQAETSQGTLQIIFEFQTMIASLTGLDAANASMYDGASALAEACAGAHFTNPKAKHLIVSAGVNPEYRETIKTYNCDLGMEIVLVPLVDGATDIEALKKALASKSAAAVAFQQPNFFGVIEDAAEITRLAHEAGALSIPAVDPITLGILAPPGEYGADIAVGEAHHFGNPLGFGGPHLGFFAVKKDFVRKMPGRLVGQTNDKNGKRGWVLTLQTREQHIRREKATSNICSNEALCAFRAMAYMSAVGKGGIRHLANLCLQKAHYAADKLAKIKGVELAYIKPFFREFALKLPIDAKDLNAKVAEHSYIAGLPLGRFSPQWKNLLLVACTEKHTKEDIDGLVSAVGGALC
jgi:glycine dehydrogenase subunit 1